MKKIYNLSFLLLLSLLVGFTVTASAQTSTMSVKFQSISDGGRSYDISQFALSSNNNFVSSTGNINLDVNISTSSTEIIEINTAFLMVAYGYHESPYSTEVYFNGSRVNSMRLYPGESYSITLKLQRNWTYNLKKTADNSTYLDFYVVCMGQQLGNTSCRILAPTKTQTNTLSAYPTTVISDVTVKSDENVALRSIRIVDAMGNTIKVQNYNGNQTEATLNLSNCKKGLYYLQIGNEVETKTVKIIKQ